MSGYALTNKLIFISDEFYIIFYLYKILKKRDKLYLKYKSNKNK